MEDESFRNVSGQKFESEYKRNFKYSKQSHVNSKIKEFFNKITHYFQNNLD